MAEDQERLDELNALAESLAALTPRCDRLQRDRLMFLAGQASADAAGSAGAEVQLKSGHWQSQWRPAGTGSADAGEASNADCASAMLDRGRKSSGRGWQAAFGGMTAVAAALLLALLLRSPKTIERIVEAPAGETDAAVAEQSRPGGEAHVGEAPRPGSAPLSTALSTEQTAPAGWQSRQSSAGWILLLQTAFGGDAAPARSTAAGYRKLRDAVFARDVDGWLESDVRASSSWQQGGALAALAADDSSEQAVDPSEAAASRPYTQRELLDKLLPRRPVEHAPRGGDAPAMFFNFGEKS